MNAQILNLPTAADVLDDSVFMPREIDCGTSNVNFVLGFGVENSNARNMEGLLLPPIDFAALEKAIVIESKTKSSEQSPPQQQWLLRERPKFSGLPIGKKLLALSGKVKGLPSDFAANHDHYLHGLPKRVP